MNFSTLDHKNLIDKIRYNLSKNSVQNCKNLEGYIHAILRNLYQDYSDINNFKNDINHSIKSNFNSGAIFFTVHELLTFYYWIKPFMAFEVESIIDNEKYLIVRNIIKNYIQNYFLLEIDIKTL